MTKEKESIFEAIFNDLQKDDPENVRRLSDEDLEANVPYTWSMGSMVLDAVMLNGDDPTSEWSDPTIIPFGRIITISGKPKLGKTTIAASMVRSVQQAGTLINGHEPITGLIDAEKAINPTYWKNTGVDADKVLLQELRGRHNTFSNACRSINKMIKKRNKYDPQAPMLILYDSIGMSSSETQFKNLYDKEVGEDSDGSYGPAKEISDFIRPLKDLVAENHVCLIIVNHLHYDMKGNLQAGGGQKLQYVEASHFRLERPAQYKLTGTFKGRKIQFGHKAVCKNIHNKFHSPEFEGRELAVIYDEGISDHYTIYDSLKTKKSWTPPGEKKPLSWQNYFQFRKNVVVHPEYITLYNEVRQDVFGLNPIEAIPYIPAKLLRKS